MRMIGTASLMFVIALAFAVAEFAPPAQAKQFAPPVPHVDGERKLEGRAIFRYDTFGDEQLWTDVLRMHEVIPTIDPATAVAVGLKVDVDALPAPIVTALRAGQVDLTNPAVTLDLLRLDGFTPGDAGLFDGIAHNYNLVRSLG